MAYKVVKPFKKGMVTAAMYVCDSCGTKSQMAAIWRDKAPGTGEKVEFECEDDSEAIKEFFSSTMEKLLPNWSHTPTTVLCPKCKRN